MVKQLSWLINYRALIIHKLFQIGQCSVVAKSWTTRSAWSRTRRRCQPVSSIRTGWSWAPRMASFALTSTETKLEESATGKRFIRSEKYLFTYFRSPGFDFQMIRFRDEAITASQNFMRAAAPQVFSIFQKTKRLSQSSSVLESTNLTMKKNAISVPMPPFSPFHSFYLEHFQPSPKV